MPHYISLANWTDKGAEEMKDAPQRFAAMHKLAESLGGKIQLFSIMGQYDFVAIAEAPTDQAAMQVALQMNKLGNVRTCTMKAFTEEELSQVLGKLQ